METVILSKEQYTKMLDTMKEIKSNLIDFSDDHIIDNAEFLQLMKISRNTAQRWRNKGLIKFSKVSGKYYYRKGDIKDMLEKHYVKVYK